MAQVRPSGFADAVKTSLAMVSCLFLVMALEIIFRQSLLQYGIRPRTIAGLPGIVFSPLLHGSVSHLLANAVPLLVLLILLRGNPAYHPNRTLSLIWVASGLGTWLIGRGNATHIGASSIVFGLVAFLIVAGFQLKRWLPAAVALLVFLLYGGIFFGALPQAGPISWEGHLCGIIAGAWTARNTLTGPR